MEAVKENDKAISETDVTKEDIQQFAYLSVKLAKKLIPSTSDEEQRVVNEAFYLLKRLFFQPDIRKFDDNTAGHTWNLLGIKLRRLKYWEEGLEASKRALEFSGYESPWDAHIGVANSLIQLGKFEIAENQLKIALNRLQQAYKSLTVDQKVAKQTAMDIYANWGEIYLRMGRINEAFNLLKSSSSIAKEIGDLEGEYWVQFLLTLVSITNQKSDLFNIEFEKLIETTVNFSKDLKCIYYTNSIYQIIKKTPKEKRILLNMIREFFESETDLKQVQLLAIKYVDSPDNMIYYNLVHERINNTPDPVDSRGFERKYREKVQSLKPQHPITGEYGEFSRFGGGYPYLRPIYKTGSGKEFTLADDDADERLRQAGAEETPIKDHGFFKTGNDTVLSEEND